MANISISEIQTTSERIQNDDLFLMSLHNNNTDTYQTARINGLQLKCCTHLPSSNYLETFNLVEDRMNLSNSTLVDYEIQSGDGINYYTGFFYTMPIDSYVNISGAFTVDTLEHYLEIGDSVQARCVQWFGVSFRNRTGFLPLDRSWAGYVQQISNKSVYNHSTSKWNGYAKRGTTFALVSNFTTAEQRTMFKQYLHQSSGLTYLSVYRFDNTNN